VFETVAGATTGYAAANQQMKLSGAAILVTRGMKVLQSAPAAYPLCLMEQSTAYLTRLGFTRYREVDPNMGERFRSHTGFSLPALYFDFLGFRQPAEMPLTFTFRRADDEQWEGCVSEFQNIAPNADELDDLPAQAIELPGFLGRKVLPIGTDAGGNWLCLELSELGAPVVDVDYGSGMTSRVAADFETFLGLLRPAHESPA
jgi:hypothetical protein